MTLLPIAIALSFAVSAEVELTVATPTATPTSTATATATSTPSPRVATALDPASVAAPGVVEPPSAPIAEPPAPASAVVEPRSPWELGTTLGGGWDSNPLALTAPVGSELGAARVWLARELRGRADDGIWLQVRYDATRFATLPDADLDRLEGSAEWSHRFGNAFTLRVVGAGALRFAGDPARSGWDAGGRAAARLRLAGWVALRLGAGYVWREASDPGYSGGTGWLDAGFDVALWRKASAIARYTLETGTDWLSGTTGTGGGGWRGGTGTRGGGTAFAVPIDRISQGVSADLSQGLWRGLFLQAGYGASLVRTAGTSFVEQVVVGSVGWAR